MTKRELAMLERAYAAEVDAALSGQPLRRLVQTRSAVAKSLVAGGLLAADSVITDGRFPVTVRGYVLTHAGRFACCTSVSE